MTVSPKNVTQESLDAARDAVLGLDPTQAPTEAAALEGRLSIPQPGVTEAIELILKTAPARHLMKAAPLVYTILEAANRAFPADMQDGIRPKSFVSAIAAVGGEARAVLVDGGKRPSPTRERQPALAAFLDRALLAEGALPASMSLDEKIGLVALSLGALRAVDRQLTGVEKPAVAAKVPGRNDPCDCGSGKKYKKCCGLGPSAKAAQ
jgi:hypothetical protein